MGKGPTIEELAERDDEFRAYLKQIRSEVEADKAKDLAVLKTDVEDYYTAGGWSYKPFLQMDALEVQQVSTWSLDNISKILEAVRDAIFGESDPPPDTVIEKGEDIGLALGEMEALELLLVNKAFAAIQSILTTFATDESYRGKALTKAQLVSPGITMFVSIRSDVWESKHFFGGDSIAQYFYLVRSYFSADQAGDIAKFNSVLAYLELATAFDQRIEELAQQIADKNTPASALPELMQILGFMSDQLAYIHEKIDELRAEKKARIMAASQQIVSERLKALN